ncbi:protein ALTERED PHOSPHATE STARVATION RESPONSE 1 [Euphorbia lathyris]|uniref:protein ALTERED PHOSPHATE STARVATION RESPONSE 1 n=1 Tax=Euphorbia lathyris TaxID=212925 RepID=UPI00331325B8
MGSANSKAEKNEALRLCKERRRFIKQAIDSRYNLAAAHVSYINSLKNIGIALRRFAEAEILIESSISTTSATELEKSPSHSSYPSPSPSHLAEISDSPLNNETPIFPTEINLSYMRAGVAANPLTVKINLNNSTDAFVEDESLGFSMPMPPPPPPFEYGGSWDYFDPSGKCESFRFLRGNEVDVDFGDVIDANGKLTKADLDENNHEDGEGILRPGLAQNGSETETQTIYSDFGIVNVREAINKQNEQPGSKLEKAKDLCAEREDPSEFITHRAKDFLSSIKDIEHRFFRASECGREVSRMIEANNIRVGYSDPHVSSSASAFLAALRVCCRGNSSLVSHGPAEHVTKVITWKRTTSSRSNSSKNPLASATRDDVSDSGSDFVEEFCMIAGSHSSTLDRLYAWERKLYDEVKASESIRKEYDRKCDQLRHQFAKDHSAQVIDKTRAYVKDLHSRIIVALHSVDTISKRIEKMRDEELQPQMLELIQGLIRMWKAMLECHHAQYITISLAYHSRTASGTLQGDTRTQIMAQLLEEVECFGLSFANWVNSHTMYVEALNGWLHRCILLPQERSKHRRPFSPRRALAPPIFVLCRDWSAGLKALPSEELSIAIKTFSSDLCRMMEQQADQSQKKEEKLEENQSKENEKNEEASSNLCLIHGSLTKVLDRLNKFSEASLKMYEDIRQKSETARIAYLSGRPTRY